MVEKEQVIKELKTIIDPELNINIVDLGLVYDVAITPSAKAKPEEEKFDVEITMTLTSPGCPLSFVFEEWIPKAVKHIKSVKSVRITLVWEPAWDPNKMSDDVKEQLGIIQ